MALEKQIGVVLDLETFQDFRALKREEEDKLDKGKEISNSEFARCIIQSFINEKKKKKEKKK